MIYRETATKVAWSFIGTPYIWGGDDPMKGFDCSGFVIEILKSVGSLPRSGDWTAQGLWERFQIHLVHNVYEGCLVFWQNRSRNRVIHVEYAINTDLCIGASGGGSENVTIQDAIDRNAYIKVRPWRSRIRMRGVVDPFLQG